MKWAVKGTGSFTDGPSDVSAQPGEDIAAAEVGKLASPRGTKKDLLGMTVPGADGRAPGR